MTDSGVSRMLTVAHSRVDGMPVVAAQGEIDITSAPQLRAALETVPVGEQSPIVDLSQVAFMGSVGLSVLLAASEQASPQRLRVVVSSQVRRPIEVTGLDQVLALYDTLDQALAAGESFLPG